MFLRTMHISKYVSPHRKYDRLDWLMCKIQYMKFHCHCNISEYTKMLNIFNFLIEMSYMYIFPMANVR